MGRPDASDLAFLDQFRRCELEPACWTHERHMRMAWGQLALNPYAEAEELIRTGIRRFNASQTSKGYHDTVTIAFARLINWRMQEAPDDETWPQFLARSQDILAPTPSVLHRYYSPERLAREDAKTGYVSPDRAALPPGGRIRAATPEDAAQMLEIYAPHIAESAVSFEVDVPSESEFKKRIQSYLAWAPWLVLEIEGKVVGYAYASKHRSRAAYQWAVEVSAYNHPQFQRQGVGRLLYTRLFRELDRLGFHLALAGVTMPNEKSVAFHESMGFTKIGIYRDVGYKLGKWHDVGWWQKNLKPRGEAPRPLAATRTISGP